MDLACDGKSVMTGKIKPWFYVLQEHHEEDFFLYIAYSDESVYGA